MKDRIREINSRLSYINDRLNRLNENSSGENSPIKLKLSEGKSEKVVVSENLKYHVDNKLNLSECVFRYGSDKYLKLLSEIKRLKTKNLVELNKKDSEYIDFFSDKKARLKGVGEVYLDFIYENEEFDYDQDYNISSESESEELKKPFGFHGTSQELIKKYGEDALGEMVESAIPVSRDEFLDNNAFSKSLFVYERNFVDDPNHGFYKSNIKGFPVYFVNHKGVKYVFKLGEKKGREFWLEKIYGKKEGLDEAEYKGRKVKLNRPKRGGSKAYYVYVRNPDSGKINKVEFGSGGLKAKLHDPEARKNFASRHNCKDKKDKTKPGYWSCKLPYYAKYISNLSAPAGAKYW